MRNKFAFAVAAFVTIATSPIAHALQNDYPRTVSEQDLLDAGFSCYGDGALDVCTNGGQTYTCQDGSCTEAARQRPPRKISVPPTVGSAVASPQPISTPLSTVLVPLKAAVK